MGLWHIHRKYVRSSWLKPPLCKGSRRGCRSPSFATLSSPLYTRGPWKGGNFMDFYKVPIGFGLALAQNEAAMIRYAQIRKRYVHPGCQPCKWRNGIMQGGRVAQGSVSFFGNACRGQAYIYKFTPGRFWLQFLLLCAMMSKKGTGDILWIPKRKAVACLYWALPYALL